MEELKFMMKKIKQITIENETIHLKKSKYLGWSVIKPYKIDGKINWKNLLIGGSWIKLIIIIIIILIILGCIYEYSTAVKIANDCLNKTNINYYIPI